jgi:hypothetical protein
MVIVFDETRVLSGPVSRRYNTCLYWGREHHLSLGEEDGTTIIFIDRHYGMGGNSSLIWDKTITIKVASINDKASISIKMEPIDKTIDKEEYVPGMRMGWIDILVNFWKIHGVELSDAYYREHYPLDRIKKRFERRYNSIIFKTIVSSISIVLASYCLSYNGFFISFFACLYGFFGELFMNFRFINITKLSKKLYPDAVPISPRKMHLVSLLDRVVTFDP